MLLNYLYIKISIYLCFHSGKCFFAGDLVFAAEWMKNISKSPCEANNSKMAVLHDHNAYCIPEEAAALKGLVTELKGTVHHQSELLYHLQQSVEARQKECQELQLEAENCSLRCERNQLESTSQRLQKELDASSATTLTLSRQLRGQQEVQAHHGAFSLESVKNNGKWMRFYTGFDGYPQLMVFMDFLLNSEGEQGSPDSRLPSALSPENQLFLVLVRLRLGLLLQDLAFRFHISESTASRYWRSWMEIMERRLRQPLMGINRFVGQRYIDIFKPQRLIRHQDMPLVALDCAELLFEAQGRTRGKGDGRRGPRARYFVHGYALVAPSGFLTFGAGAGEELPTLPPFLQARPVQLTAQQETVKRQVLSLRSLTDKAFSFRFLRVIHPQNMEDQVCRAWTISCYLACLLHEPMGLI
ncbi:hypothetical protein JD844_001426 [Phrynosoma platyrhinos]|uniref:Transposase Helix-turn-helix domain-containing protein n=1 Tax=Phrynosoma platyrhinos TaxID=52577 RepID=A0ABQ7T9V8_PHRPL|nr:hypothetical protein JD844_001426 [Phrynosoma platyrhinos]